MRRILVVDDNAINLEATQTIIEQVTGVKTVETAISGRLAITKVNQRINYIKEQIELIKH